MTRKPPEPPRDGAWARAVATVNAETEARAHAAGVEPVRGAGVPHAGRQRPDLWEMMTGLLGDLNGDAAARLTAALHDPLASEELICAVEHWERMKDGLAAARANVGLKRGAVAVRLRETREGLPDGFAAGDLVDQTIILACEGEGRVGIEGANELKAAAREYAHAARRLRAALARAEAAAPKAKAPPPDPGKAARERLAAGVCRALGGEVDGAFEEAFGAIWRALTDDDADNPDPPHMQATRDYIRDLKKNGGL